MEPEGKMRMEQRPLGKLGAALACLWLVPAAALAEWQAVERVQTYAITGQSGPELYASIGARGPRSAAWSGPSQLRISS